MVMKVLVILLAILQGGLTNQNNLQRTVKPIEGIEFEIKLSNDTISYGDSLQIALSFKNTSQCPILFCPKARICIMHNYQSFVGYDSDKISNLCLNTNMDPSSKIVLDPNTVYSDFYRVKIKEDFFNKGTNDLYIFYLLKVNKKKFDKDIANGYLESSALRIFIKE